MRDGGAGDEGSWACRLITKRFCLSIYLYNSDPEGLPLQPCLAGSPVPIAEQDEIRGLTPPPSARSSAALTEFRTYHVSMSRAPTGKPILISPLVPFRRVPCGTTTAWPKSCCTRATPAVLLPHVARARRASHPVLRADRVATAGAAV